MKCPFCQSRTKVYNSRSSHQATQTWRRRQCLTCGKSFTTREKVDFNGAVTVRTKAAEAPYSRERLLLSLVKAGNGLELPPEMLLELTDSIELELKQARFFAHAHGDSNEIVRTTTTVLARYDTNLAVQYINHVYRNKPPLGLLRELL